MTQCSVVLYTHSLISNSHACMTAATQFVQDLSFVHTLLHLRCITATMPTYLPQLNILHLKLMQYCNAVIGAETDIFNTDEWNMNEALHLMTAHISCYEDSHRSSIDYNVTHK